MERPEFHILFAGAASVLAALGISGGETKPVAIEAEQVAAAVELLSPNEMMKGKSVATGNRNGGPTTLTISPDGLYYINSDASGSGIRFLVDTGASITVLTGRDASKVAHRPSANKGQTLRTVNGRMKVQPVVIDSLNIAGRELQNVEAVIVHEGLPASLLGQNALSELGSITMSKGQMTIY